MRHASLFSGIGAPELAAYWLGWENVFHCEINPFCRQVLNYWFTNSKSYEDITKTDFREWQGKIDVLTGGFPCQPFSVAGKRKGTEDNRYLWPEFKRAIREIRPPWVVGENVAGILSMVQPSKKADMESMPATEHEDKQEFVIETICKDLEAEGYTVQPIVIPACAVGAPHRRDRVWFIACNNSFRLRKKKREGKSDTDGRIPPYEFVADSHDCPTLRSTGKNEGKGTQKGIQERNDIQQSAKPACLWGTSSYSSSGRQFNWCSNRTERPLYHYEERDVSESESERFERKCRTWKDFPSDEHTDCIGLEGRLDKEKPLSPENESAWGNTCGLRYWEDFPTQPPICRGDDGISDLLDTDAIFKGSRSIRQNPYSRWRTEAIKAYGNAMVPQVIYQIYKTINEIEQ